MDTSIFAIDQPTILIIEDEPLVAKGLIKELGELLPQSKFLPVIGSVKMALDWFGSNPSPDLIFCDTQLSDGISFEIFERHKPRCPVIFTTAYDQYALRAFEVSSVDYLLKPIGKDDLVQALEKIRQFKGMLSTHGVADLAKNAMSKPDFCQRFLVRRNQSLIPIDQGKVGCFQKKELIYLWTSNGEKYLTDYQSLDDLEKSLNPGQFFRANRQFIIRIDSIKLIKNNHKGMELSLICGVNVDVSKEKRPLFKRWLMEGY